MQPHAVLHGAAYGIKYVMSDSEFQVCQKNNTRETRSYSVSASLK